MLIVDDGYARAKEFSVNLHGSIILIARLYVDFKFTLFMGLTQEDTLVNIEEVCHTKAIKN